MPTFSYALPMSSAGGQGFPPREIFVQPYFRPEQPHRPSHVPSMPNQANFDELLVYSPAAAMGFHACMGYQQLYFPNGVIFNWEEWGGEIPEGLVHQNGALVDHDQLVGLIRSYVQEYRSEQEPSYHVDNEPFMPDEQQLYSDFPHRISMPLQQQPSNYPHDRHDMRPQQQPPNYPDNRLDDMRPQQQFANQPNDRLRMPLEQQPLNYLDDEPLTLSDNQLAKRRSCAVSNVANPDTTSGRPSKRRRRGTQSQAVTSRQVYSGPSNAAHQVFVPFTDEASYHRATMTTASQMIDDCPTDEPGKRIWVEKIKAALKNAMSAAGDGKRRAKLEHSETDFEKKAWYIFIECRKAAQGIVSLSKFGIKKYGKSAEKFESFSELTLAVVDAINQWKVGKMLMDEPYLSRVITAPVLESVGKKSRNNIQGAQRKVNLINSHIIETMIELDETEVEKEELQNQWHQDWNNQDEADGQQSLISTGKLLVKIKKEISGIEKKLAKLQDDLHEAEADLVQAKAARASGNNNLSQAEREEGEEDEEDEEGNLGHEDDAGTANNSSSLAPHRGSLHAAAGRAKGSNGSSYRIASQENTLEEDLGSYHQ